MARDRLGELVSNPFFINPLGPFTCGPPAPRGDVCRETLARALTRLHLPYLIARIKISTRRL